MSSLKKSLLYGFALGAMITALGGLQPAGAQTSNSQSNSTSAAGAQSGSSSGAAVILNQNAPSTYNGTNNVNERVSGGTNNQLNTSGHTTSDVTVRTTPTVYAPPVSGGNPCTLAVSGGVSVIGWGAAAGGTFVDQDCANRQKIAMVHNAGYQAAARELMCNDKDTYMAFRNTATPCGIRAAWEPNVPLAPVARPVPGPTPVVYTPPPSPVADKVYPKCNPRRGIVDNCVS